jgi:L-2-hydroxycarboxylate dehydrogenase (NAD+)
VLERFKLKEQEIVRVPEKTLRKTVESIFKKMGVPEEDAKLGADALVTADMRGVESHGVSNMLRNYVRGYQQKTINPTPHMTVIRSTPATASIDCDAGLGIIIAPKAMELACEKANKYGIGMVTMKNGQHMGMVSYHAMVALKYDMIGMAFTSSPPEMIPTFGAEPKLGTNPICLAAPADKEPPFVYDGATTVVAGNKLGLARRMGIKIPGGWVADNEGTPIMQDTMPPAPGTEVRSRSNLLPLGSTREMGSHKGYGLACVVEILSGILTGGGPTALPGRVGFTHCVTAYNIEAFMDKAEFKKTMDEWLRSLKATKPAVGHDRVFYPGLPEAEAEIEHKAKGIPFHPEVITWFQTICKELKIKCEM